MPIVDTKTKIADRFENGVQGIMEGPNIRRSMRRHLRISLKHLGYAIKSRLRISAPTPAMLAESVEAEMAKYADEDLDGKLETADFPLTVTVTLSQDAWEERYGESPERFASIIEHKAKDLLYEDYGVTAGTKVTLDVTYLSWKTGEYDVVAGWRGGKGRRQTSSPLEEKTAPLSAPDSFRPDEDSPSQYGADVTPCPVGLDGNRPVEGERYVPKSAARAYITLENTYYTIESGKTIGVVRKSDRIADITLPNCDDLKYVSRIHGRFDFDPDSGTWSYTHLGQKFESVVSGEWGERALSSSDACKLHEGDVLAFGISGYRFTFTQAKPSGDAVEGTVYKPHSKFNDLIPAR